jgi:Fungal specific transcription factor domain
MKFGVLCDGYKPVTKAPPREQRLQKTQAKQLILPKYTPRDVLQDSRTISINRLNGGVGFEDELNGNCFRIYLEETARQINGPFPSSLWSKLIPQISEAEPFVRHAIIAIGALEKHSRSHSQGSLPGTVSKADNYQYALKLYEKSLRGMRDAIARGKHDLRNALIACLLVFTFEGMLGNQAAAAVHAESGLNLLFNSAIGNNPGLTWEAKKASTHQHFEDDLLEAFNALDLQLLLFMDKRSKTIHEQMKMFQTSIIETMPADFTSLDQARHFWKLIINRNYHFLKSLQSLDIEILQEQSSEEGSANMGHKELLLSDPKEGPMTQKEEHLRYRIDIGRWTCAYIFVSVSLFECPTSNGKPRAFPLPNFTVVFPNIFSLEISVVLTYSVP